ncbi:MAG: cytochrome C oxidase subunit IV family protein [Gemmataceae bacterium]|nr:cytochrome C oxidase subunit IV family protein [Gemmataceae bacterium]
MHDPTHAHAPDDPPTLHDVDKPGALFVVFLVVLGLSAANVGLALAGGLGKLALPVQLAVAAVQACVVAYYWMHLRRRDTVVTLTAVSSLFFMFIMFVLVLSDYLSRHHAAM